MLSQSSLQPSEIEPRFIGFAGHIGAGKTTAAKYLSSEYGLQYTRYSQVLRGWLGRDDAEKDQLQDLGWQVMGGGLQKELNARLIAGVDRSRGAAIDGLRHPIDFQCLSAALGLSFYLIFLESAQEIRFERRKSSFSTYEDFQYADSQPVETFIDDLKPLAAISIKNDGPLGDLYATLDRWMTAKRLGEKQ